MTSAKTVNGKEVKIAAMDGKLMIHKATVYESRHGNMKWRDSRHRSRANALKHNHYI